SGGFFLGQPILCFRQQLLKKIKMSDWAIFIYIFFMNKKFIFRYEY
ncbi:hypothetical protein HMPREF3033_00313, partial [Veillonellaceae bacterium DNF00751]